MGYGRSYFCSLPECTYGHSVLRTPYGVCDFGYCNWTVTCNGAYIVELLVLVL